MMWKLGLVSVLTITVGCTLIGCKKSGHQAAAATQPSATSQPTNPFGGLQNDTEGFSQHPWEQTVDDFRLSFLRSRQKPDATSDETTFDSAIRNGCTSADQYMSYFASVAMERLEEVPGGGDSAYFADKRFRPTEASVFCDYQERSDFFFYKDKFSYAVQAVDSDPTSMLAAKYALVGSMTFHSGDRLDGQYDISLYRRGSTNTRIYDVAYAQTDSPERRLFLIYIPTFTLYQLGAEVNEKVAAAKAEELKASQVLQQQTQQRVQ